MEGHFTTFNVLPDGHVRGLSYHVERLVYGQRSLFGRGLPDGLVDAMRELREPNTYRVSCFADSFNITARAIPPSEPISCAFYPLVRELPRVKHDDLAPQWEAQRAVAADDAILVTGDLVTEGTMFNVGFITPRGLWNGPQVSFFSGRRSSSLRGCGRRYARKFGWERSKGTSELSRRTLRAGFGSLRRSIRRS